MGSVFKTIFFLPLFFFPALAWSQGSEIGQIQQMQKLQEQAPGETKFADLYEQLKVNPRDPAIHTQLGMLYLEHKLFELSQSAFAQALSFQSSYAAAHVGLSQLYRQKGLKDRELIEMAEAVRLEPNNADYVYRLGVLYMEPAHFNYKKAEQQYRVLEKMASPLLAKLGQLMQKTP